MVAARLKTRFERVTLTQEARVFLPPAAFWRCVQLVLPADRRVFIEQDVDIPSIGAETLPDGGGGWGSRAYKGPPLEGGQQIEFPLAPGQWLVGMTETGVVHLTAIIAYAEAPSG